MSNNQVNIYASKEVKADLAKKGLLETFQANDIAVFVYDPEIFAAEESIITCAQRPLVLAISNKEEFERINKVAEEADPADLFVMWCGRDDTPKQREIPVLCVDQLLFQGNMNVKTFQDETLRARRAINLHRAFN